MEDETTVVDETTDTSAEDAQVGEEVQGAADSQDSTEEVSSNDEEDGEAQAKPDPRNQPVPFSKLQKEINRRKEIDAENARLKDELEKLRKPAEVEAEVEDSDDSPELDETSKKALAKALRDPDFRKTLGVVTRDDLERDARVAAAQKQLDADKTELSQWAESNGFPKFDVVEVDKWADANIGEGFVKNKNSLQSAYRQMHADAIEKALREGVAAEVTSTKDAVAERPGAGAKAAAIEERPKDMSTAISRAMKKIKAEA